MALAVKKGKVPQLMLDGKRVEKARFVKVFHSIQTGKDMYRFDIPADVEDTIPKKKTTKKKSKPIKRSEGAVHEDQGNSSEGETLNNIE